MVPRIHQLRTPLPGSAPHYAAMIPAFLLCLCISSAPPETDMSYLDNGQIRLGVDLSIGGSITYLADSGRGENVINSHDWGRQVQMSFYSGPVPFEPERKTVHPQWKFLGWNPIQSGDCFGNRSRLLEHKNDGKEIYVRCIPMHWPAKEVPAQCTFESWLRLEGRTVRVRSRLNNARQDKTQYPGRGQEQPAVYTNGPYHRLFTYDGDTPFSGKELREIRNDNPNPEVGGIGIRWAHWQATEKWAALVNDDLWGLGVWSEGPVQFCGGFFGRRGAGGPKDAATGYIAPLGREILDHDLQYEYRYTLILDSLENIRRFVYAQTERPAPPRYAFDSGRGGWIYHGACDTGLPIRHGLEVVADGPQMQLLGPDTFWRAESSHVLRVEASLQAPDRPEEVQGRLYWKTLAENGFDPKRSLPLAFRNDGAVHEYRIPLGTAPGYEGPITGLRLDPIVPSTQGDRLQLKSLRVE